ncbi:MAG TPA: trehalase family glycosidase [Ktedonobacteraceae bacterium]
MTTRTMPVSITTWHAASVAAHSLVEAQTPCTATFLPLTPAAQEYSGQLDVPGDGVLVCEVVCPRPLRLWLAGVPVLDEALDWRSYQREVRACILFPGVRGPLALRCEVGARPTHLPIVDRDSPARDRAQVLTEVQRLRPDGLVLTCALLPDPGRSQDGFPVSLRFLPTQFWQAGTLWQHVLVRTPTDLEQARVRLAGAAGEGEEGTTPADRQRGQRRWYVPMATAQDEPPPVRTPGQERRVEPLLEIVEQKTLTVACASLSVEIAMPLYETLGRAAPHREYHTLTWPTCEQAPALLPEPVLPARLAHLLPLYTQAWQMLLRLVRDPSPASGLPNSYVATGSNFPDHLFVWDSCFTTLCLAYGHRALPATSCLDILYARQFDGGYIHREYNVHDGQAALFEPGFSPNPPLLSLAEWQLAALTGARERLAQVYPLLCGYHRWIAANRRLPDGTCWTTGLASGLDNSPARGEGSPCLTAQMAHDAAMLGRIAGLLGRQEEAEVWEQEYQARGQALNRVLWDASAGIYAHTLPGGGHCPHRAVTAFWPLWAGLVAPARVEALLTHLQDPQQFWRHHPLPSLAADAPDFAPAGEYWRGSTWAPTNYAVIKGLQQVGREDLACALTTLHLQRVFEVWSQTGKLWENYCSERSLPGNNSAPDYCWSALGPIALLLEVILGLMPDATRQTLRWQPAEDERVGVTHFALGPATLSLLQQPRADGRWIEVRTDRRFVLELLHQGALQRITCQPGFTELLLVPGRAQASVELAIEREEPGAPGETSNDLSGLTSHTGREEGAR